MDLSVPDRRNITDHKLQVDLWALIIGAVILGVICSCFESDSYSSPSSGTTDQENNGIRHFSDGTWDVECVFGERQKSDGTYSYKDFWDREVTSDGRIIDNFGSIYDKSTGERIGTRWTDCFGIVHDEID